MQPTKPTNPSKPNNKRARRKAQRPQNPKPVNAAPTAISLVTKTRVPAIKPTSRGVVVTHREYVQDVTAADANFRNTTFSVNPGLATTFPWLSAIAGRFESYLFRRLHFVYEPICPTTTPGAVMMAVDYDAADAPPTSKVVLMSYKGAVRSAPWNITRFDAARGDLRKFGVQRYVRTAAAVSFTDIKTYDVGSLQLATQNTPAQPTTLGELYVDYEVEFFTPQIPTSLVRARRNVTQTARVEMPAVGNIILDSIVTGDTNSPPFWLHNPTNAGVNLILDANRVNDFYLNLRAGDLSKIVGGPTKIMQVYDNIKTTDANNLRILRVGSTPDSLFSWGFSYNPGATDYNVTHYVKSPLPTLNPTQTLGANLIPLYIPRPSSGTNVFTLTLTPIVAPPEAAFSSIMPSVGEDWGFPQLDLPSFTSTSLRMMVKTTSPNLVQTIRLSTDEDFSVIKQTK